MTLYNQYNELIVNLCLNLLAKPVRSNHQRTQPENIPPIVSSASRGCENCKTMLLLVKMAIKTNIERGLDKVTKKVVIKS
jgi:hypothetical protein